MFNSQCHPQHTVAKKENQKLKFKDKSACLRLNTAHDRTVPVQLSVTNEKDRCQDTDVH